MPTLHCFSTIFGTTEPLGRVLVLSTLSPLSLTSRDDSSMIGSGMIAVIEMK
jgi:hypothetical protein